MTNRASWPIAGLTLKVLDLDAQIAFYQRFGFELLNRSDAAASLGAEGSALLALRVLEDGRSRLERSAGLYHFAILVPDESVLGSFWVHARSAQLPFVGAADHLVSQALYFEDPEGNGIEVYSDRPSETWRWRDGKVVMDTLPLDLARLQGLGSRDWAGFPSGTVVGHMHLTVGDLDRSAEFYSSLGMDVVADLGGFFRFMSWDGYHHHLGLNLAQGRGAAPVDPATAGLESFTIRRPGAGAEPGADPDGIFIEGS